MISNDAVFWPSIRSGLIEFTMANIFNPPNSRTRRGRHPVAADGDDFRAIAR